MEPEKLKKEIGRKKSGPASSSDDREIHNLDLEAIIAERTSELARINHDLQCQIEEQKRIEEVLRGSEALYKSIVENVKEIIFQTDTEGLWIFLNKSWEEITGFSVAESLGLLFVNYVHPEDRNRNMELFAPLINRKKDYCRHEIRYLTKSGGFKWVEVFARLGLNESDEVTGTYGTLRDITERKQLEESLLLNYQKEKELNELKSRFVSMTSHEFRTPLTSILFSAESLAEYWDKLDRKQIAAKVLNIKEQSLHLVKVVDSVFQVSKIQEGKVPVVQENIDMLEFCYTTITNFNADPLLVNKIQFRNEFKELTMSLDIRLIHQVVDNLVSNAVKYSKGGQAVVVRLYQDAESILLSVQDHGIGVPLKDQEQLFRPYFRAGNTSGIEGNGLGLNIAMESVKLHGGGITFSSSPDDGSLFIVHLPLSLVCSSSV